MKIDVVSTNIIKLALFIDKSHPGFVSELWLDEPLKSEIKTNLPTPHNLKDLISETQSLIDQLPDARRKNYLSEILKSLIFQIKALDDSSISFEEFSRQAYGFEMKRVTPHELIQIQSKINNLEKKLGLTRQQVYEKQTVSIQSLLPSFENYIHQAKELLPDLILDFPDKGFRLETVSNKPWSAFNSHEAPFTSKLSINTDVGLTYPDLHHLAFHEAYGGHHSELSLKDKLLLEGRGEHGLVITFSPQTFISEAIAEGIYDVYQNRNGELESQMVWSYNRLIFALQNLSSYLFFDDKKTRQQINEELKKHSVSDKTRENILNFSTDPLFGRYAPVYYSAYNFFNSLYQKAANKEKLVNTLFTQPCTPSLLLKEFST